MDSPPRPSPPKQRSRVPLLCEQCLPRVRFRRITLLTQQWHTRLRLIPAAACLAMMFGCLPRIAQPIGEPIDQQTAVGIVNRNIDAISDTLRASGTADGYFTTADGTRRSFSLGAVLFFLPPQYLRFDLRSMGRSELLVGSNDTHYWICTTRGESWYASRPHNSTNPVMLQNLPINPSRLIESLGLTRIPIRAVTARERSPHQSRDRKEAVLHPPHGLPEYGQSVPPGPSRDQSRDREGAVLHRNPAVPSPVLREGQRIDPPIQRIVDQYQQLLFITRDDAGRTLIEKEYWLDRRAPRLIRRVIFRDADGSLKMEARLDDYAPLIGTDLILPGRVSVHWPGSGAKMDFRIKNWRYEPKVTPTGRQFTRPHKRGLRFDHEDIEE